MKYSVRRFLWGPLAALLLTAAFPGLAFAKTKTVTNISLKTVNHIEAGSTVSEGDIGITEDDTTDAKVYSTNSKYTVTEIELVTSQNRTLKVGDEIKLKAHVEIADYDYVFRGSYSSSHVTLSGGATFVSASRKSSDEVVITLKLKPVGGQYDEPEDAFWSGTNSLGHAKWEKPYTGSSGYYDLVLYRGSTSVYTVNDYKGNTFNFYPWMTKAGDYYFKVRTVPHTTNQGSKGKKSDWVESDYQYVDERHVSDGSGQNNAQGGGTVGSAGWEQQNGIWYYKCPDGTYKKNGWEKVEGKWYLFDGSGRMLTGWQTTGGQTYYLNPSGDMKTGWHTEGNSWYYLNPDPAAGVEGALLKNQWLDWNGTRYYLTSSGAIGLGWQQVDGRWYYFNAGSEGAYGGLLRSRYVDTFWVGEDGAWVPNY